MSFSKMAASNGSAEKAKPSTQRHSPTARKMECGRVSFRNNRTPVLDMGRGGGGGGGGVSK